MDKNQIKEYADNLLKGIAGLTSIAEISIENSLDELKKSDPKKAEEQARIYANALNTGDMSKSFDEIKKQIDEMKKMFKQT